MENTKIKFIFVGNKAIVKEPQLINGLLSVYLNSGSAFSVARENKKLFEYLLNGNSPKEIVATLKNPKFYEFISKIPNLKNYIKSLDYYNFSKFNNSKELINYFKTENYTGAKEIITGKLHKEYFDILKEKYTTLNEIKQNKKTKTTSKPKRPALKKIRKSAAK